MFRFKGTIIRPNNETQSWYIHRVHTLWDRILFTDCIDIKVHDAERLLLIAIYIVVFVTATELFHADGRRTDMTKLIVAFRNFANGPKIRMP